MASPTANVPLSESTRDVSQRPSPATSNTAPRPPVPEPPPKAAHAKGTRKNSPSAVRPALLGTQLSPHFDMRPAARPCYLPSLLFPFQHLTPFDSVQAIRLRHFQKIRGSSLCFQHFRFSAFTSRLPLTCQRGKSPRRRSLPARKTLSSPPPPHRSEPAFHPFPLATARAHAPDLLEAGHRTTSPPHASLPLMCKTTGFNGAISFRVASKESFIKPDLL